MLFEKFNLDDLIYRERDDFTPIVVMMCGVAGSGKTTFAQQLEKKGFVRLSIMRKFGLLMVVMGLISQLKSMRNTRKMQKENCGIN
jgi:adenylate kinase